MPLNEFRSKDLSKCICLKEAKKGCRVHKLDTWNCTVGDETGILPRCKCIKLNPDCPEHKDSMTGTCFRTVLKCIPFKGSISGYHMNLYLRN